jgi:hypothetical protein
MIRYIITHSKSLFARLTHNLTYSRSIAIVTTLGLTSIGAAALSFVGGSALVIVTANPAQATCLLGGTMHNEIADSDCFEAQRTGCVRHLLTETQYRNCLAVNAQAQKGGAACILHGQVHTEFSPEDCAEAKATGCVRRLLTPAQYVNCINVQKH